jgi:hypothetical protein
LAGQRGVKAARQLDKPRAAEVNAEAITGAKEVLNADERQKVTLGPLTSPHMSERSQLFVQLSCHGATPCQTAESIDSLLVRNQGGDLSVTYRLMGNVDSLWIPPPVMPRRADGLWRHTCFEAFIAVNGRPAYYEFNFSPSGEWATYFFRSYRDAAALEDDGLNPDIRLRNADDHLELDAVIQLDRLPEIEPKTVLRLGLSAVIEDTDCRFSYWALKHPPGKPDFHHPDGFILEIQPPLAGVEPIDYTRKP